MSRNPIPIVDLFAGPGGLGEGFSAVRDERGDRVFDIRVSIEKDPIAHRTLTLRALYRALAEGHVPDNYYDYIRGDISWAEFASAAPVKQALGKATHEAHRLELGGDPEERIDALIADAIKGHDDWVLIGGPPCQAYSLAGRSRRRNVDPDFEDDPKHFLYREYLRIIRKFQPSIFVMENVKGILSSTHGGQRIFDRIRHDLSMPGPGINYDIRSFVAPTRSGGVRPDEFVIRSECFNIPQMRHRVILLGVRADRAGQEHTLLQERPRHVAVREALAGLPPVRSRLSKEPDSVNAWLAALEDAPNQLAGWRSEIQQTMKGLMRAAASKARRHVEVGGPFIRKAVSPSRNLPEELSEWLYDPRLGGVSLHETRSHMRADLHRYLFASCFAREFMYAPKLSMFPDKLLPKHRNLGLDTVPFEDRFRVQLYGLPSTTIVSHIAKDGHYYIHPDASQCRSLTVREAARLQSFPDNYFFEGNRTQQYHQVGNAVPPFLAKQLGAIVAKFLRDPKKRSIASSYSGDLFADVA